MKALILVDLQNDFMPGGVLGVPQADQIIPGINRLISDFSFVVTTQDCHPEDHVSFDVNHPGKKVGESVTVNGLQQTLWPVHCVQNSQGAELVEALDQSRIAGRFFKGTNPLIDSYSAFYDNAHLQSTGLGEYLKENGVDEVVIVGVATDYCVLYSVLDALQLGFKVTVMRDLCRGIDLIPGDVENALRTMQMRGAKVI